jgi:hypothetical protein
MYDNMEEVGGRREAVKVGDVFITFIFVLSFWWRKAVWFFFERRFFL